MVEVLSGITETIKHIIHLPCTYDFLTLNQVSLDFIQT